MNIKSRVWQIPSGPYKGLWAVNKPYIPSREWARRLTVWSTSSYHSTWREAFVAGLIAATLAQREYIKQAALEYGYQ